MTHGRITRNRTNMNKHAKLHLSPVVCQAVANAFRISGSSTFTPEAQRIMKNFKLSRPQLAGIMAARQRQLNARRPGISLHQAASRIPTETIVSIRPVGGRVYRIAPKQRVDRGIRLGVSGKPIKLGRVISS